MFSTNVISLYNLLVGFKSPKTVTFESINVSPYIDNEIIRKGKKTSLSNKTIRKIIYHIDCSLNDIKTYSITLFNITDKYISVSL